MPVLRDPEPPGQRDRILLLPWFVRWLDLAEAEHGGIEANPPALVAVRSDFLTPGAEIPGLVTDCRNAFPQVAQFIRERYTQVVYNKDGLILLGPAETASRPGALTR